MKTIKHPLILCFGLAVLLIGAGRSLSAEDDAQKYFSGRLSSDKEHPVKARIIQEYEWVQPGRITRIGVYFELQSGWHIYAEDPGDAGLPTVVEWKTPKSISLGQSHWPKPHEFEDPGNIHTFGYEGDVVFSQKITLKQIQFDAPIIPIRAEAKWLACKLVCIPGSAVMEAALRVNTLEIPDRSEDASLFEMFGS